MIELSEGRWRQAERDLLRYVEHSDTPLLNYLAAARAGQQQHAYERRDEYLHLAQSSMPSADVAVALTQAELQLAHQQHEQALATLTRLRAIAPRHTYALRLLVRVYQRLEEWEELRKLLARGEKEKGSGGRALAGVGAAHLYRAVAPGREKR